MSVTTRAEAYMYEEKTEQHELGQSFHYMAGLITPNQSQLEIDTKSSDTAVETDPFEMLAKMPMRSNSFPMDDSNSARSSNSSEISVELNPSDPLVIRARDSLELHMRRLSLQRTCSSKYPSTFRGLHLYRSEKPKSAAVPNMWVGLSNSIHAQMKKVKNSFSNFYRDIEDASRHRGSLQKVIGRYGKNRGRYSQWEDTEWHGGYQQ